jgi:CelD/BcsL family acetyltransferase involved in cellulose biosynthesis
MQVELFTDLDKVPVDVLKAWGQLARLCSLPYATPAWMLAFWRELHEPSALAEPRLIVVREGEELIGIGPFFAGERRRVGLREWWPLGVGIGQRTGPLARPGREQEAATAFSHVLAAEGVTTLRLPAVDSSTPWTTWLSQAWPGRPRPKQLLQAVVAAPQVVIRPDRDYEAWLGQRSRNFRSEIARRRRLTAERGGRIRCISDPYAAPAALASLFSLHRNRLAALGRLSLVSKETERAVSAGTVQMMASGQARIWVVEAGDEIVAADLHLIAGSRMCCYNGGIDLGWTKESLGTLLLEAAVRDAHALGVRTLDLGAGDQFFKGRFASRDAPLTWSSLIPRGVRYPLERARLAPEELRSAGRRVAQHLPDHYRHHLRRLRRVTGRAG